MKPHRSLIFLIIAALLMSSAGCSGSPAVLPEDPLCGYFPSDQISSLLPPGTYDYTSSQPLGDLPQFGEPQRLKWQPTWGFVNGDCTIATSDGKGSFSVHAQMVYNLDRDPLTLFPDIHGSPCYDTKIDITAPTNGQIIYSGGCTSLETNPMIFSAQVMYWGGVDTTWPSGLQLGIDSGPVGTVINVSLTRHAGHDGIQDAARVLQAILNTTDELYAQNPPVLPAPDYDDDNIDYVPFPPLTSFPSATTTGR